MRKEKEETCKEGPGETEKTRAKGEKEKYLFKVLEFFLSLMYDITPVLSSQNTFSKNLHHYSNKRRLAQEGQVKCGCIKYFTCD